MHVAHSNEYPDHAALKAQDDCQWLDPGASLPERDIWAQTDVLPVTGTERTVRIARTGLPFVIGAERWLLFVPAPGAENGWDEHPETIPASAFVRAKLLSIERTNPEKPDDNWLRFEILQVIRFDEFEACFPARARTHLQTWQLSTGALTRHGDWELWWAPHDDAGYWLLARIRQDGAHILAAGEWLWGATLKISDAWAGHVVMPISAWRAICADQF